MSVISGRETVSARPRAAAPRCPWCKDALQREGGDATRTCLSCGTETHEECLRLHGRCPVHGCGAGLSEASGADEPVGTCRRCHESLEHARSDVICASCLGELWERSHNTRGLGVSTASRRWSGEADDALPLRTVIRVFGLFVVAAAILAGAATSDALAGALALAFQALVVVAVIGLVWQGRRGRRP